MTETETEWDKGGPNPTDTSRDRGWSDPRRTSVV